MRNIFGSIPNQSPTKEERYDRFYSDIASRVAEMSHAVRKKVGCVIVKDGNIISFGWNGMPAGMDNSCETEVDGALVTRPEVSHAEENSLCKISRSTMSAEGSTVYVTMEPCIHCAKLLFNSGAKRVAYTEDYRDHSGIEYLSQRGIKVDKL